ncbi:MAG: glucose-inhibited division protein A, partial [Propionibacteriaceae bacterium]
SRADRPGAAGRQRQVGRPWTVHAGAVVLATGGTTWKSHSLGGDVDTGEGHLMAAEVGAHLSSMEFSNFYGMVPLGTSMDKNGFFVQASYWDHTGAPLHYRNLHESRAELLAASLQGTITAQFTQFAPEAHARVRSAMPNFFMVADKLGIDPFTTPFPMDWVQEGTVRGTGGVRILDRDAWTGVAGLYAAGDVAARDRLVGAATGAGGPNLAWAIATGTWAGRAAAGHAQARPAEAESAVVGSGTLGVRPRSAGTLAGTDPDAWRGVLATIQAHMLPIDRSVFRDEVGLVATIADLERHWDDESPLVPLDGPHGAHAVRTREVAGMLAMARWAARSALARPETRGMHTRVDHPQTDPAQARRLLVGGLDEPWVRPDPELPVVTPATTTATEQREA